MMNKLLSIVCLLLLSVTAVNAQRFSSRPRMSKQALSRYHRFVDFSIGGGYHSMNVNLNEGGKDNGRFGSTAGAYYRYAYWRNVHLFTGLGATLYSERSKYNSLETVVYATHPDNGEQYTFKAAFRNWEEIQRTVNLEVPVGAFYTNFIRRSIWRYMVGGGVKLEIPIVKKFVTDNGRDGEMSRSGYFPSTNVEYEDFADDETHGFYSSTEFKGKATTRFANVALFCDAGLIYPINSKRSLYIGAYFSHGLLNLSKGSGKDLYSPDSDSYSGIVSSNLVSKNYQMAVGLRAAFTIGF